MSPAADQPSPAARHLGQQLKELRMRAGLDQAALARELGLGAQSQVSRFENAQRLPPVPLVRDWARLSASHTGTAVDDEGLIELRFQAGGERRSWNRVHNKGIAADQGALGKVERRASELRVFQSSVIPGQLQTAHYARRLLELATTKSPEEIAAGVQARLDRQAILYDPPTDGCHFLITEAALRWRPIGDPRPLLTAQLDRLLALLDLPGIDIGLLTWDDPQPATHRHPFVLYRLPDDEDDMVIIETVDGENVVRDTDLIQLYLTRYDTLRSAARTGDQAREVLHRIMIGLR